MINILLNPRSYDSLRQAVAEAAPLLWGWALLIGVVVLAMWGRSWLRSDTEGWLTEHDLDED